MTDNFRQTFNIIKQRNSPNEAVTIFGDKVFRQEKLFAPEPYNTLLPVLQYGNHFIYEIPDNPRFIGHNFPAFMCSCGSWAGIIGISGYKNDASPEGLVFACAHHNIIVDPKTGELWGKHADGSTD